MRASGPRDAASQPSSVAAVGRAGWLVVFVVPVVLVVSALEGPLAGVLATVMVVQLLALWARVPRLAAGARFVVVRLVPTLVGCMVVLVALDWGVGALWDRLTSTEGDALDLAGAELPPTADERVRSPAMADVPWADRYFAELAALPIGYLPFVGPREQPVHGRTINVADGIRRSYEPPGAERPDAVTVWFFGGSTLWGDGQRDLHTIPSEVARLAEADGVTLRVVNFGVRSYTAFQEFLVFEQELATREPPDLAVFYNGPNELYTLLESPATSLGPQPTMFQLDRLDDAFTRALPLPGLTEALPPEPSVGATYLRSSLLTRLLRNAHDAVESAAAAQGSPRLSTPEELDRAVVEADQIYRRSVALLRQVAAEHDVPTVVFWQPGGPARPAGQRDEYAELGRRVRGVGIDISDALDDPPAPIYIDGLHTNELGARLSAEAIWSHLQPSLGPP